MKRGRQKTWTPDMEESLKAAREKRGLTFGAITTAMNLVYGIELTRNAVIGKWFRMQEAARDKELKEGLKKLRKAS